MSATYTHTRTAAPRYEIRGGPTGAVPCANVPHVAVTLKRLGAPLLSDAHVYSMVRAWGRGDSGSGAAAGQLAGA